MKVLIFASTFYEESPYAEWLSELGAELFVLAPKRTKKSYAHIKNFFPFARYWSNQNVEWTAFELARQHQFAAVLAKDEWDLVRAAWIRDLAAIPGPGVEAITAFRDKLVMKTLLQNAGIPVAHFSKMDSIFDAIPFVETHGYPVVIKPKSGVAGAFTRILKDRKELEYAIATGLPPHMMIEAFVPGTLYHVDGLWQNGRVAFSCSSRYVNSCLSYQWGGYSGSIQLPSADPLHQRLSRFTQEILQVLPTPSPTAFHCEIFVKPDGSLVCCEIACRPGGARIVEQTQMKFGVHLEREWVRGQLGLPMNTVSQEVGQEIGHMFVPARNGKLVKLPELGQFSWARSEKIYPQANEILDEDPGRRQNLASCIIEGEVESRMLEWNNWISCQTQWEQP